MNFTAWLMELEKLSKFWELFAAFFGCKVKQGNGFAIVPEIVMDVVSAAVVKNFLGVGIFGVKLQIPLRADFDGAAHCGHS